MDENNSLINLSIFIILNPSYIKNIYKSNANIIQISFESQIVGLKIHYVQLCTFIATNLEKILDLDHIKNLN